MSRLDQDASQASKRIGRYEVLGEIASGGMATVFLARSLGAKGFSRLVAIKRLHPHLESEEDFVTMFLDEARLAARIRHPNVVATLDVEDSEGLYLVMEYIEGVTLLTLARACTKAGEKLPAPVTARIALDTLSGLHAAHEIHDDNGDFLGLVHRDVSPQNILLGTDGVARLTDFGIAKATSRLGMTRDGQLKGKISYMSPEQTRRGEIDRRVDVFSMGIVVWELLAGRRLFQGESDVEVLNQLLFEPIPRLRDHAPSVPTALEQVVMTALDRDPNARWASASHFAEAIEKACKVLGGPANHRAVAAFIQKICGERIARERGRIANGLPPIDPSTTGSFKALDGPLLTPSRVRNAAAPTPMSGPLRPDPFGPPREAKRPATLAPAHFSAQPNAGVRPRAPAPPLPAAPAKTPPLPGRPAKQTVLGMGAPSAAPRGAPRVDLTFNEDFDEELPTMQAAAAMGQGLGRGGVRPVAPPPEPLPEPEFDVAGATVVEAAPIEEIMARMGHAPDAPPPAQPLPAPPQRAGGARLRQPTMTAMPLASGHAMSAPPLPPVGLDDLGPPSPPPRAPVAGDADATHKAQRSSPPPSGPRTTPAPSWVAPPMPAATPSFAPGVPSAPPPSGPGYDFGAPSSPGPDAGWSLGAPGSSPPSRPPSVSPRTPR
ncbi:MAG: serine/threonine-protein kinase [Polyangiales bacterium]